MTEQWKPINRFYRPRGQNGQKYRFELSDHGRIRCTINGELHYGKIHVEPARDISLISGRELIIPAVLYFDFPTKTDFDANDWTNITEMVQDLFGKDPIIDMDLLNSTKPSPLLFAWRMVSTSIWTIENIDFTTK